MPTKTPKPTDPIGPSPAYTKFVSCTPTTLKTLIDTWNQTISQGRSVRLWLYVGRCFGGTTAAHLTFNFMKTQGPPNNPKSVILKGTMLPVSADASANDITVTIGNDFVAGVDDGQMHPQIEGVCVASDVKVLIH